VSTWACRLSPALELQKFRREILIPETKLLREKTDEKPFKWAGSEIGFRSKIGGSPEDCSTDEYPICPSCKERMEFYGQLDSLNDSVVIADCGMILVFLCFVCFESKSMVVSG